MPGSISGSSEVWLADWGWLHSFCCLLVFWLVRFLLFAIMRLFFEQWIFCVVWWTILFTKANIQFLSCPLRSRTENCFMESLTPSIYMTLNLCIIWVTLTCLQWVWTEELLLYFYFQHTTYHVEYHWPFYLEIFVPEFCQFAEDSKANNQTNNWSK